MKKFLLFGAFLSMTACWTERGTGKAFSFRVQERLGMAIGRMECGEEKVCRSAAEISTTNH